MPRHRDAVALFLFLGTSSPLFSQDIPQRVEEPQRKQKSAAETQEAAQEAKRALALESGQEVTYDQVLERPDDIDLNYRYALSQVHKGNLRSAAATLERVLMVNPNLPKVRLVYAIVLFRLDTLDDAERELTTLKAQPMPQSLRSELQDYLDQIHKRRRRTHYNVLLGAGFDYDDNRNAAPATGRRLFFDTPITLSEGSTRKSDTAKIMLASLGCRHDLGYQEGHEIFADYSYYRAEQTNQRILNLQNHSADLGIVYRAPWADITPTYEFDHLLLTQTTYLRSHAGRLHLARKMTPRFSGFLEGAYTSQLYNRTLIVVTGDERTGDKYEGTVGASYVLTPTMSLLGSYTRVSQGAKARFDAYRRDSVTLGHNWLLGRGRFLLTVAIVNVDRYDQAEAAVSATKRRDSTYRGRLTLGLPLDPLGKAFEPLLWTFTYEYYHALSNLPNYSYSNNKLSTLLSYRWGS